jgi:hypothetical protein
MPLENLTFLEIHAVTKAEDLFEESTCTKIYDGLELTVGKLKTQTEKRVAAYIKESEDITSISSRWISHLILTATKGTKYEADGQPTNETNESKEMLELIQKIANIPQVATTKNAQQEINKKAGDQNAVTARCCSCISNMFRVKPKAPSVNELKGEPKKSVKSILLGHSKNVSVEVEILEGKEPPFEIKIYQEGKAKYRGQYNGFYSWPRNGEITPDHFYGEFSDGERINFLCNTSALRFTSDPITFRKI